MIFIWGQQCNEKKLGYVAEYCGNCREVRTVKVLRVGKVWHVYYIPLGEGTLLGYDGVCRRCELRFGVSISDYPAFESDKKAELLALAEKTNPKLMVGNEAAVAEWRRMSEIRAPFVWHDHVLVQRSLGGTGYDTVAVLAFLGSFAVPIGFFTLAGLLSLPESADPWITLIAVLLFGGGLIWTYDLARKRPLRYFRENLEARLREDVQKLLPTREELETCIAGLREYGYGIAKLVSIDRIVESSELSQPGPRAVTAPVGIAATTAAPSPAPALAPAPVRAQKPTLVLTHGGKEYKFSPGVAEIVIGRARENSIVLNSKFVSRSHLRIAWSAGSEPRLKTLSKAGASIRLEGISQPLKCIGEVLLKGSGTIALASDYAAAEVEGDVIHFEVAGAAT